MPIDFPKNTDEVLNVLDFIGTLFFAISGYIALYYKKLDLVVVAFIAFVTAVGGGTARDLLLGTAPIGWMQYTIYVILSGVGITFLLKGWVRKLRKNSISV